MREGYQIYRTKENVLISCTLIKGHLTQGTNLNITIEAVPEPTLLLRLRPVSRPASYWSIVEEVDSPPSYQDVLTGRFESRPVYSPLEEELVPSYESPEPLCEPESRPEPRRTNTDILLKIPLILIVTVMGERHPASCSLSKREKNFQEAFHGQ